MWISNRKAGEFFDISVDMIDTCSTDIKTLHTATTSLGEVVDAMRQLVEIQEKRIGLTETHNKWLNDELVSLRADLVDVYKER